MVSFHGLIAIDMAALLTQYIRSYLRLASWTEWKVFYMLCKDKEGLLQKETIRAVYDGSIFLKLEAERKSSKKKA